MNFGFTRHASERFQQRGFKKEIQELILKFGEWIYVGGGCYQVAISRASATVLLSSRDLDPELRVLMRQNFDKVTRKAMVVGDRSIVTVMNRTRRRKEP